MNVAFISRAYHASKLAIKAAAPTIMVVGGVVSMGASAITAGKKTLEVEEVLAKHTPNLEKIKKGLDLQLDSYTENQARNDRIKVYSATAVDLTKLYAIPIGLFVAGASLVFGGHRIMLQRNATLALGFTALQKAFDTYRGRVRETYGEAADQGMLNGWVVKEVIDNDGKVETIAVRDWDAEELDPYNRVFEQGVTAEWQNDFNVNKNFLRHQRQFAQEKLNRKGILYLSEVYEALGFAETDISRVVGWKVKYNPDGSRDIPHVDFGLDKAQSDDWSYSREKAVYLDFNCQGLIIGGRIQKILEKS